MTRRTLACCLFGILFALYSMLGHAQDLDPEILLERYLATGDNETKEQIKERYPGSAYHHFCNTYELLHVNNQKAKELAEALIRDHPDFALGYFALGTIYGNGLMQYSTAIIQFNKSIDLDSLFIRSWTNRGMAKIKLKDYQGAKEDFNKAVKLKRGYALGYILRGVANYWLDDDDAMLADFEIGLQLDFKALSSVLGIAGVAVDEAIERAPENVNYYYARGYAHFANKNYRTALDDFTKTLEMVSGSSEFHKYAGASKVYMADTEGAQVDLNIALGINPDDPDIYYYLGILMNDHQDQPSRAYEYFNHAIELDDKNPLYYFERSKSSYNLMDYPTARDDVNTALYLNHYNGDFYALRGYIKMKMGSPSPDYCHDFNQAEEWGNTYNLKRIMKKSCQE